MVFNAYYNMTTGDTNYTVLIPQPGTSCKTEAKELADIEMQRLGLPGEILSSGISEEEESQESYACIIHTWSRVGSRGKSALSISELLEDNSGYEDDAFGWIENMLEEGIHDDSDGLKRLSHYHPVDKDEIIRQLIEWLSYENISYLASVTPNAIEGPILRILDKHAPGTPMMHYVVNPLTGSVSRYDEEQGELPDECVLVPVYSSN